MPTEAEWEYAARGGAKQEEWAGTSAEGELGNYGDFWQNFGRLTAEVGSKQPNLFGLYALSCNVEEWMEDCWHENDEEATKGKKGLNRVRWRKLSPADDQWGLLE